MQIDLPSQSEISKLKIGISCFYYKIPGQKLGIKFYENKRERDYALQMQELSYFAGVAPKTGKIINHAGYYGFVTEHVTTLGELYRSQENVPKSYLNQLDNLVRAVYNCCEHEVDTNWLNFGIIGKQLVCIDFGFHCRDSYSNLEYA